MTRSAAIVGVGITEWGNREAMWKDLVQEAAKAAFDDADYGDPVGLKIVDVVGPGDRERVFYRFVPV